MQIEFILDFKMAHSSAVAAAERRIREIDEILASGVIRDRNDGSEVEFDPDSLRAERRSLKALIPSQAARRPVVAGINMGGF